MRSVNVGARLRAATVTAALTAGVLAGAIGATATEASAAPISAAPASASQPSQPSAAQIRAAKINRVMTWASHQRGKPYSYGAAGPSRFDCSGLVMYVFKHAIGRSLSHNAEAQYRASRHISRRYLRPGDLVFEVSSSGYAYHVGIYAGNGYFWHAPHSGTVVKKQKMYSAHWRFGRIIR
jgi:cell wall-associated NlpC family hydrolase